MAILRMTVCDVCEAKDRAAERYILQGPRSKGVVDLCEEHAAPIEALLTKAGEAPSSGSAASRGTTRARTTTRPAATGARLGRRAQVTSLEDIEAMKQARS